jgi:hypothetical protein
MRPSKGANVARTPPQSPVERYYDLLDRLIEAKLFSAKERTAQRRVAASAFSRAMTTLGLLGLSWSDAAGEYRDVIECHARYRHDFPYDPIVTGELSQDGKSIKVESRCQRCSTIRVRRHEKGQWFDRTRGDTYKYPESYKLNGQSGVPTQRDYQVLFGAIQMIERAERKLRRQRRR